MWSAIPLPLLILAASSGRNIELHEKSREDEMGAPRALVIGVDTYDDDGIRDLQFAAADAKDVANQLVRSGSYDWDHVVLMTPDSKDENLQPTATNVVRSLIDMGRHGPVESVLFYFSGHGGAVEDHLGRRDNYIFPSDLVVDAAAQQGIRLDYILSVLNDIETRRRLIILDACRNNFMSSAKASGTPWTDPRYADTEGTVILYATRFGEYSYEDAELKRGRFTAALVQGLSGRADGSVQRNDPPDGVVSARELFDFVSRQMREVGRTQVQVPYLSGELAGEEFPVVLVPQDVLGALEKERPTPQQIPVSRPLILVPVEQGSRPVWKNGIGYAMVQLEPQSFWMGSKNGTGEPDEHPWHKVELRHPFLIGATEVTQGQWHQVMGNNPAFTEFDGINLRGPQLPMQGISWFDAIRFANTLSDTEGLPRAYQIKGEVVRWDRDSTGYRLPTEAEWEYAAKGGMSFAWPGSDDIAMVCSVANTADATALRVFPTWAGNTACEDGFVGLAPVGSLRASEWGLYDMSGNVFEWVWDWFGQYSERVEKDPTGPDAGTNRIVRGGSMGVAPRYARTSVRVKAAPDYRAPTIGFRLARSVTP